MKLRARLLALLMIAAMLLSGASAAFADDAKGITVSENDMLAVKTSVYVTVDGKEKLVALSDADDDVKSQLSAYCVKLVDGDSTAVLTEANLLNLLPLLSAGKHIVVTPPDGYYVSAMNLTNGASSGTKKSILPVTDANAKSSEVTLTLHDLLYENSTNQISSEYLSSDSADSGYRLNVELKHLPVIGADDVFTVRYSSGDFSYSGALVDENITDNTFSCIEGVFEVKPLLDSVVSAASETLTYEGLELVYPNGSRTAVKDGDMLVPYMDGCVLEAQWDEIEAPDRGQDVDPDPDPIPDPIPDPDPDSDPDPIVLTITADSATKEYDGQPLTKSTWSVSGTVPAGYQLNVWISGTRTEAGTADNVVTGYQLLDANSTDITNAAYVTITTAKGTLQVTQKMLTLTAITGTVKTDGKTEVYASSLGTEDGTFTNGYKKEGLLSGHNLSGDFVTGSGTKTFTSGIDVGSVVITDTDGNDVKGNYNIVPVSGTVTIEVPDPSWIPLTITIKSGSWTYDGTAHTLHEYEVSGLTDGDVIDSTTWKSTSTITNVGRVDNEIETIVIKDADGNVVNGNKYAVTYKAGTLEVKAKMLTITAVTGTVKTDGKTEIAAASLSMEDGTYKNGYKQEGLLSGHILSGDFVTGSGTKTFNTGIDTAKVEIKNGDGKDVKGNYEIKTVAGKVTIDAPEETGIKLTITTKDGSWTYDGKAHSVPEYEVKGLKDGDVIAKVTFKKTASITDVGKADNEIESVVINTKDGQEVAAGKYAITYKNGTLEVKQKDLKITAISGTFTTDGTKVVTASSLATEDGTFRNGYKAEGLINGHTLSGSFVTGSDTKSFQSNIDTSKVTVKDSDGKDVSKNYKITGVAGTITIVVPQKTNVPLTVTAKSGSWVYDGTGHTLYEYEVNGLVDGDKVEKVTFKASAKITNVGTQANEIEGVVIKSSSGAAVAGTKYSITYKPGTLTVTKFPITLTAESASKDYDGTALVNKNVKATALANSSHKLSAGFEIKDSNGNTIKNSPVNVGTYTKKITNVVITDGSNDVTANYDVTTVDGTLTILAAGSSSTDTPGTAYHGGTYTLRSDAAYKDFQKLLIDGNEVSPSNYTVKEGSTVITLKSSYVDTLRPGTHTYSIVSTSSTKSGTFVVSNRVKTGDESHLLLWIVLLIAAAIAITIVLLYFRKMKQKEAAMAVAKKKSRPAVKEIPVLKTEQEEKPATDPEDDVKIYAAEGLNMDELLGADEPAIEPVEVPEEDDDPTKDLMKDFELDLDLFKDSAPVDTDDDSAVDEIIDSISKDIEE